MDQETPRNKGKRMGLSAWVGQDTPQKMGARIVGVAPCWVKKQRQEDGGGSTQVDQDTLGETGKRTAVGSTLMGQEMSPSKSKRMLVESDPVHQDVPQKTGKRRARWITPVDEELPPQKKQEDGVGK